MSKEKIKKPFYKKWWVWVLAIIIIGGIGSSLGGEEEATTKDNQSKATEEKADKTSVQPKEEKQAPKEEVKSFGIGQEVNVGDMTYTITAKNTATQVGPSALPTTASGKYVVVDVTLKNNGNDAVTVDSSFFKLKRGEKTYEADSSGSMSANQGENGDIQNSFFLQKVNPDSTISGKVVFDVAPEVADATDLQIQVQTGVFGTETEIINLQ